MWVKRIWFLQLWRSLRREEFCKIGGCVKYCERYEDI